MAQSGSYLRNVNHVIQESFRKFLSYTGVVWHSAAYDARHDTDRGVAGVLETVVPELTDQEAWDKVLDNQKLVRWATGEFVRKNRKAGNFTFDDLLTAAQIGAFRAAKNFDPDRGVQFSTFLVIK